MYCDEAIGTTTNVKVGTQFSEEFAVKFGFYQEPVSFLVLFAIVPDVVIHGTKKLVLQSNVHRLLVTDKCYYGELLKSFSSWQNPLGSKGQ